ncbi:MAG: extracellular solute-binding protein [Desulfofustis sp.]|nr:extracellular solute-binding protein [Desulfofustis sp.]
MINRALGALIGLQLFFYSSQPLLAAHGLAIDGNLKYPFGFEQFNYVSDKAEKGGDLTLHAVGSFDKMNPFTLKGSAPEGLQNLVFETLTESSLDEPFAQYGLLAKDIMVAEDGLSVTFVLHEEARFADGSEVTAEDVKFSVNMMKSDLVHPLYPYYYADITDAEIKDKYTVTLNFKQRNRELPLIAGQIPVMSKAFYEQQGFDNRELLPPLGSGPYRVKSFKQGRYITYERNPEYWAREHPVRKHMYNFDTITYKYYKDRSVAVEAFKAGEFDLMLVNVAKQWVRDIAGPKVESGAIIKQKFPHRNNAGMQGFVMNTRRPVFRDKAVRQAIGLAFDFEWTNKTLFYDQYERSDSYFSNSYLAATGLPSDEELELLNPLKDQLPNEVFSAELQSPTTEIPGGLRTNLRQAMKLLQEDGWSMENGVLQKEGVRLSFEIILVSSTFERVMAAYTDNLKKIGIEASYRTIDSALYTDKINNFDFDMCVFVFGQSQSPGNEQINFWHSKSANRKGSRNLAGIQDAAVDTLIDKIIYAQDGKSLTTAARALDRVLWYGYYVVPNWYLSGHRLAYHNKFELPSTLPTYYDHFSFLMTWWHQ